MLTDWEQRQLAEIERGLAEDFTRRRRAGRLLRSVGLWGLLGTLVVLGCLVVLATIGAWWAVISLGMVFGLCVITVRHRSHARRVR